MQRLADAIEARLESFAEAESQDSGKPLALARTLDIPRAVANLRFFAAAASQWSAESHAMEQGAINYTLRLPLGVVGCISPWNLPLYLFTWKIAPALAAGNTVVAKPSEVTPYTAWLLGTLAEEAGFPPGVLNIVHGSGPAVGEAIVIHETVKAVSFTGSTRTGVAIAAAAAPRLKKVSLELGGKNPTIVFDDFDFADASMATIVRSGFANQGEICLCGSRLLVQRPIYERFRREYLERVRTLRVGDPLDERNQLGALVSKAHFDKVSGCIERARAEGGSILIGGGRVDVGGRCAEGWFIAPTVIEGLAPDTATNQEEIFGPVVTLIPFDSGGRGAGDRQRHALRTCRVGVDSRCLACAPLFGTPRVRHRLGELLDAARPAHAVRRHEAIRRWPRRRFRGHAFLHRSQEHLHRSWAMTSSAPKAHPRRSAPIRTPGVSGPCCSFQVSAREYRLPMPFPAMSSTRRESSCRTTSRHNAGRSSPMYVPCSKPAGRASKIW